MFFITDFMANGSVEEYLNAELGHTDGVFDLSDTECIRRIGLQTARALGHLHVHGIVHRDVASRNLLLDDRGTVQLCDFGLARFLTQDAVPEGRDEPRYTMRDELQPMPVRWMAPESLIHGNFSTKTDVWMLGVTLWEVWTRSLPHHRLSNSAAIAKIISGAPLEFPPNTPEWLQNAISACCTVDPDARCSMWELEALLLAHDPELLVDAGAAEESEPTEWNEEMPSPRKSPPRKA
jgi:serine/threonine protein kinase